MPPLSPTPRMDQKALRELLAHAAEEGAMRALAKVGLDDDQAKADLKEIRDLLAQYRLARSKLGRVILQIVAAIFGGTFIGSFLANKLIGG